MESLEDYLPQIQLLTLQNYNNTIIAYQAYVRFGKKAIADYCREKIRKEVRVTVKDDDYIKDCAPGNHRMKKTYLVLRNKKHGNIVTIDKAWFYRLPKRIQELYYKKWDIVIK